MDSGPTWVAVAQLFLTGFLGLGAATIAFMQWRTAHMKTVLELYQTRNEALVELFDLLDTIVSTPGEHNKKRFLTTAKIHSLFGEEFTDAMHEILASLDKSDDIGLRRYNAREAKRDLRDSASEYIEIHDKRVLTPAQWFKAANKRRKSYGVDAAATKPDS